MKNILKTLGVLILALSVSACSQSSKTNEQSSAQNSGNSSVATVESSKENESSSQDKQILKVGASPSPHAEILEKAKEILAKKDIDLEIIEFTDYVLPNTALESGDIDANYFQHKPYLEKFNTDNKTNLVPVADIHFEPLGLYAGKSTDINNIKEKAVFSVPNDSTNEARALLLLQDLGIIKLKDGVGLEATPIDIVENPHNIEIFELEAAQLVNTLQDVDFAVINGNYALDGGILDKVISSEKSSGEACKTYANIICVKSGNENNPLIKELIEVMQSEEIKTFINDRYQNLFVPAF